MSYRHESIISSCRSSHRTAFYYFVFLSKNIFSISVVLVVRRLVGPSKMCPYPHISYLIARVHSHAHGHAHMHIQSHPHAHAHIHLHRYFGSSGAPGCNWPPLPPKLPEPHWPPWPPSWPPSPPRPLWPPWTPCAQARCAHDVACLGGPDIMTKTLWQHYENA